MPRIFAVIVGFVTLVGTCRLFLDGPGFYISVGLSLFFCIGAHVAWRETDRANRLRAILFPVLSMLLRDVGKEVVDTVIEIAERPGMKDELVDVLVDLIKVKPDPTERRWIYTMLGKVPTRESRSAIKRGLSDEDEFARGGAEEAWRSLSRGQGQT